MLIQIYVKSRYARVDVALLRTLDQLIFWSYIVHKKERLDLVMRLFLNGGNFCKKFCRTLFFMLYHTNFITYYMQWIVVLLVRTNS